MNKLQNILYDEEKIEWDKIKAFLETEGSISSIPNNKKILDQFKSIQHIKPIHIHETWKFSNERISFDIICLDYTYTEQEELGDGQIGAGGLDRLTTSTFTSFWFTAEAKLPKMMIEPITAIKKIHQLIRGNRTGGNVKFNLNYIVDADNAEKTRTFLNENTQKIFLNNKKVWFESSGNAILVRDNKAIKLDSFKKKFQFTKEFFNDKINT